MIKNRKELNVLIAQRAIWYTNNAFEFTDKDKIAISREEFIINNES